MTPAMAASAELIANTATATALALMPIRLAVVLLNATARTALPILVLRRAQSNTIINASVTPNTRISCGRTPAPRIVMTPSLSGEASYRRRPPGQQRQVLDDDAEADGAHHPGQARLAHEMADGGDVEHIAQQAQDQHGGRQGEQERAPGYVPRVGKSGQPALAGQQDRADADQAGQRQERALSEIERLGRCM